MPFICTKKLSRGGIRRHSKVLHFLQYCMPFPKAKPPGSSQGSLWILLLCLQQICRWILAQTRQRRIFFFFFWVCHCVNFEFNLWTLESYTSCLSLMLVWGDVNLNETFWGRKRPRPQNGCLARQQPFEHLCSIRKYRRVQCLASAWLFKLGRVNIYISCDLSQ